MDAEEYRRKFEAGELTEIEKLQEEILMLKRRIEILKELYGVLFSRWLDRKLIKEENRCK